MQLFSDSSLPSLDEGTYSAVLTGVVWLGLQAQDKRDAEKYGPKPPTYRMKLLFEIPGRNNKFGEPEVVGKTIKNVTTNAKGAFLGLAGTLVGKKLQTADLAKYLQGDNPFKEFLGKQYSLTIAHFNSADGIKSYVETVAPMHPRDDIVTGTVPTVYFNPGSPDMGEWDKLTFYTKKDVMNSVESGKYSDDVQKGWLAAQEAELVKQADRDAKKDANDYSALA